MVTPARDQPSEPSAEAADERVVVSGLDQGEPTPRELAEASEGDALDQERAVAPRAVYRAPSIGQEASEADLLDQAREVPLDEDLDR